MQTLALNDKSGRSSDGSDRGYKLSFMPVCQTFLRNNVISENTLKKLSELSDCQYKDEIKIILSSDKPTDKSSDKIKNDQKKEILGNSDNLTKKQSKTPTHDITYFYQVEPTHQKCSKCYGTQESGLTWRSKETDNLLCDECVLKLNQAKIDNGEEEVI
jgi:hypothetical protein